MTYSQQDLVMLNEENTYLATKLFTSGICANSANTHSSLCASHLANMVSSNIIIWNIWFTWWWHWSQLEAATLDDRDQHPIHVNTNCPIRENKLTLKVHLPSIRSEEDLTGLEKAMPLDVLPHTCTCMRRMCQPVPLTHSIICHP